ncbi:MAG: hypothetical protein E2O36_06870 [Proteobacteria bacterium]|nr:MAG: hypothetical protein E2O36_06870 [Pseudomonadota bacterium]
MTLTRPVPLVKLTMFYTVALSGLLPSNVAAIHQHHIQRHQLARYYTPALRFFPLIPLHTAYDATPAPIVIQIEPAQAPPGAAKLFAYPAHGQTEHRQAQDRYECHAWALHESRSDAVAIPSGPATITTAATVAPVPGVGPSALLKGTIGGAALGAIGGAIAGDPGIGAVIGAAIGGTIGLANQAERSTKQHASAVQAAAHSMQKAAVRAEQHSDYTRAMGACLVARGYAVN